MRRSRRWGRLLWPLALLLVGSMALGCYRETAGQRVIDTVWKRDTPRVKRLLAWGANPNVCRTRKDKFRSEFFCRLGSVPGQGVRHHGWTPLMIAARQPEVEAEMATVLLQRGADVHATGWLSTTPLTCAAEAGNLDLAKVLLQWGANVNQVGTLDHTPLMVAAGALPGLTGDHPSPEQARPVAMVHLFLKAGAGVNVQNRRGQTALMFAAAARRRDIVVALLSSGAAKDPRDRDGRTAQDYAREAGDPGIVTLLADSRQ